MAQYSPSVSTAIDATQKKAIISLPGGVLPHDMDSAFWMGTRGGIVALTALNAWIAALRLQSLIEEIVLPLAAQYVGLQPEAATTLVAQQPSLIQFAARWHHDGSLQTLWPAYQNLMEDYRNLRNQLGVAPSPMPALEQMVMTMLDIALRQPGPDIDHVISWRSLSIILPAYNEQEVIAETVNDCLRAMRRYCPNAEVIVVDDGSKDRTGAIGDELAANDARVVVVHNRPNKGYGGALLAGFAAARGEMTFFMDSDGQFDINDITRLLAQYEQHPGAVVLGYRAKRHDPFMRKANAWGWKLVSRMTIGVKGIKDIDCAFKLFPTRVMRACQMRAQGASVNAEFLAKFLRLHLPIYQIPVQHLPRTKGSPTGAKLSVIIRAFSEIFSLRRPLKDWERTVVKSGAFQI